MPETVSGTTITVRRIPVNAAADQLLANFTVTRPDAKESSILQMTLTSTNPDKAADTLNKLIAVYNDHSTEERRTKAVKTKDFIRRQRGQIGADLKEVDQKMDDNQNQKRHHRRHGSVHLRRLQRGPNPGQFHLWSSRRR